MDSAEKLLAELIALPSVNSAFLPPGDARAGEGRVAEFLAAKAAMAGLSVEFQEVFPNRSNLLARLSPVGKIKKRIILAPHLDTVGNSEMSADLFRPRKKNGQLHGRGACDTKGSVAAMFSAVLGIAESGQRPGETEIVFAGLVDEENAQQGSWTLAKNRMKADLAIVGEPTQLRVITAHKGDLWLKLVTRGKAAHGARPELGDNAVHTAAKIVHLIETKYATLLKKRKHGILGSPTINVGAMHGGTQPNIVPDHCEILLDRRSIPGENDRAIHREIVEFIRANGLEAELMNYKYNPCPPMETNPNLPLVRQFMELAGQKKAAGVDFFCDASVLSTGGIPSVVFGPGDIAQAHTADEWISLESLAGAQRLLAKFLRSLP
jgi:succinyl-diaminopimelate desuccinylase